MTLFNHHHSKVLFKTWFPYSVIRKMFAHKWSQENMHMLCAGHGFCTPPQEVKAEYEEWWIVHYYVKMIFQNKPSKMPFYPPHISYNITCEWNWGSLMRSRELTTLNMVFPQIFILIVNYIYVMVHSNKPRFKI